MLQICIAHFAFIPIQDIQLGGTVLSEMSHKEMKYSLMQFPLIQWKDSY